MKFGICQAQTDLQVRSLLHYYHIVILKQFTSFLTYKAPMEDYFF